MAKTVKCNHYTMTPQRLAEIKAKPHGPDVAELIAEIERLWATIDIFIKVLDDLAR